MRAQKENQNKWKFFLIIGISIIILIQIGIMFNCSSSGQVGFMSCKKNTPSYIQETTTLEIQATNSSILINVEIADELPEHLKGLMFRDHLDWNKGMLFVFNTEVKRSFWMKNTLIPLDIMYLDKNLRIIDIYENIQPCETEICEKYPSKFPAKYVLEVNSGFIKENEIRVGDRIKI